MRNVRRALALSLVSSMLCVTASASAYTVSGTATTQVGAFQRTQWTVQDGADPLDKFRFYRVRSASSVATKPVLLTPAIASNFEELETSLTGAYSDSLVAVLANAGYDVWGISQRADGLTLGVCEAVPSPCGAVDGWGVQKLLDDIDFVNSQISVVSGGAKPAIGGLSMGGALGFAAVNRHPGDYSGVIAIDGGVYEVDPVARLYAGTWCTALDARLAAGLPADPTATTQKLLAAQALAIPALAPVFALTLTQPAATPFSFRPGYVIDAGNLTGTSLVYADISFVARAFATYNDYVSVRTLRDLQCSLAGTAPLYANLGSFTGRIFAYSAGKGFGPIVGDTAALSPNATKTSYAHHEYGHRDMLFGYAHTTALDQPLLAWLAQVFP